MGMSATLESYLRARTAPFQLFHHDRSATSLASARLSHLSPERLAKAVVLEDGDRCVVAVLPANRRVQLNELNNHTGRQLRLASEGHFERYFPDCVMGAVPALACAYGMETILDESLMAAPEVYFEAGDHETLVRMRTSDFLQMAGECGAMRFAEPVFAPEWTDDDDSN